VKFIQNFSLKIWKTRVFGRPVLTVQLDLKEMGCENVDWFHRTRDRNYCLVLEENVMDFRAE
jgi:hypothetical protein